MNAAPLDELYFRWLYEQVAVPDIQDRSLTYWKVFQLLFTKEFIWLVDNDENRIQDGKALRHRFLEERDIYDVDRAWIEIGCSVFELMVGLSERLAFLADRGEPHYWFWVLMDNLGLREYTDDKRLPRAKIDNMLNLLIFRQYEPDGSGGFFPLNHPEEDQRQVEIWQQLSEYINSIEQ